MGIIKTIFSILIDILFLFFFTHYITPLVDFNNEIKYPQITLKSNNKLNELINNATSFFNLPVWSRAYVPCYSKKSEITCAQLIKAYEAVLKWKNDRNNAPFTHDIPQIVHVSPKYGVGNKLYHITTGILIALSLNRTLFVNKHIDGVKYADTLHDQIPGDQGCNKYKHIPINNYEYWQRKSAIEFRDAPDIHITVRNCLPYFLLMESTFANYIYSNFGIHFVYYLLNYATDISDDIKEVVFKIFNSIPPNTKVIGIHIRHHNSRSGQFISSLEKIDNTVVPFLRDKFENGIYIAIASDSQTFIDHFKALFPNNLIVANVERKADGETDSAMTDIALLMMCNEMIGTLRSTFSCVAAQRAMIRPYFLAMENPYLFQFSSSQLGISSAIYESIRDYNYMMSNRAKIYLNTEEPTRIFFRNMII